jgi:phosphatidylserine/phosphatidylglycerophosphate/cardiolipin synthase-like enzyme
MTTYIDPIQAMLQQNYPQPNPLWNYSADNEIAANWLLATPTNVWGLPYSQFKQAVPGSGPLELQTCTVAASGTTQLCQAMDASVTTPGQDPQKLLIGHSDAMVDAIYDVMTSAEVLLDVTTLTPPTDRFLDAFKNALLYLSRKPAGQRPIVRILYSNPLPNVPPLTAGPFIEDITSGLDPNTRMQIYVYVMSSSFSSWNHAKIVAADGASAIVGGHNMWGPHYLGVNPVHDVSMRLTGTAARHAQDYANSMWAYGQWRKNHLAQWIVDDTAQELQLESAYQPAGATGGSKIYPGVLPDPSMYGNASASFPPTTPTGQIPVLAVGRGANTQSTYLLPTLGSYLFPFTEPGDEAIVKLVSLAQTTIRMSLQSFQLAYGVVAGWNRNLLNAMAGALNRGVNIYVVISNPNAVAGGLTALSAPYGGDQPSTVNAELVNTLVGQGLSQADAEQTASQHLSIAQFRYSSDPAYNPGNVPIGNHAKTLIVDDTAFYIGSQNMYSSNLNEFGYIVEDAATAQSYVTNYWTPLWSWSKGTATTVIDPDVVTDHQVDAMQFILALPLDTMLNLEWTMLLSQYNAATDPTTKSDVEASMDELITASGFDTTASTVLAGLQQPFFTETAPSTEATAEALRFVANLMVSPQLMIGFNQAVMTSASSVEDANTAINKFLSDNGYSCTVLQVIAAFAQMQTKTQAYWSGTYPTWLTDDGGVTYANTSNSAQPNTAQAHALQAQAATDDPPLPALGPSLVVTATGVTYGGVAIVKPTYNNNQLTWSSSDGNATSASIQFGTVTRGTLNDSFTGSECFGSVTYPAAGGLDYHGTYSLYGRAQVSSGDSGSSSSDTAAYTIGFVAGALVLAALLAGLGYAAYRAAQNRDAWMKVAQDKRNSDGDGTDVTEKSLTATSSPKRLTEGSVIESELLRGQVKTSEGMLLELAPFEENMDPDQRDSLESSGTSLRDSSDALDNPSAAELPTVVSAQKTSLADVVSNIQKIVSDDDALFTSTARDQLLASSKVQSDIIDAGENIAKQQEDGGKFEFESDVDDI